jgi:hypothetical protein
LAYLALPGSVQRLILLLEDVLGECARSMLGFDVRVEVRWLERQGVPVAGDASSGDVIRVNLSAVGSAYGLLRVLAHEAVHLLQMREYGVEGFSRAYERYAYAYNPFESQADSIADMYADDSVELVNDALGPLLDRVRELTWLLGKLEVKGELSYVLDRLEAVSREALNYLREHFSEIVAACRKLPSIKRYYEQYGLIARRYARRGLPLPPSTGTWRERRQDNSERRSVAEVVRAGADRLVEALADRLAVRVDGCRSTYCLLMRLESTVDEIEELSADFGFKPEDLLSRVVTHERVTRELAKISYSVGEAEQLLNTPHFPKLRRYRSLLVRLLEQIKRSQLAPSQAGSMASSELEEDGTLRRLLDRILQKLLKHSRR